MHRNRQSGQALLMVTFSLSVIFGMLALAMDLGWAYFRREAAQAAADAAALAAVKAVLTASPSGIDCAHAWCAAATQCPAAAPGTATSSFDNACMLAAANGFTTSGRMKVTVQAGVTSPAPTVNGVDVAYWVTVRVSDRPPGFFGSFAGNDLSPTARATAAAVTSASGGGGCIYVLDPSANNAFNAGNNARVTLDCGVYVNSSASSPSRAMYVTGSAFITAPSIRVVGDYKQDNNGNTSVTPVTDAPAVTDPFATLPAPSTSGTCTSGDFTPWKSSPYHIAPGKYCGFRTGNGMQVQLDPGVYVIDGSTGFDFSIQGGSTLTGSDVTFYLTGGAVMDIANGTTVNLNAPDSGTYKGVLFYQDRTVSNPDPSHLAGGANMTMSGSLYFPNSLINIDNGTTTSGTKMALVAKRLNFQGGTVFRMLQDTDGSATGIGGGFTLALIE